MANRTKLTRKKRGEFLALLAENGNVSAAARAVGLARRYVYEVKARDEEFSALWDEAVETGLDALEQEVRRRAIEGVEEPIYYEGRQVGTKQRYSDTLAIFLLKGGRPEKYRERHEITGAGGEPLMQGVLAVPMAIDPEQWAQAAKTYQAALKSDAG